MGLIKQSTQESYTQGLDVPAISPIAKTDNLVNPEQYTERYKPMNKDKRILVQGILQAVIQSQGLLLEPNNGYINKVKEATLDLVKFVEEHSK